MEENTENQPQQDIEQSSQKSSEPFPQQEKPSTTHQQHAPQEFQETQETQETQEFQSSKNQQAV